MIKKTKLCDVAKDLRIDNQEIIDLMEKYDGVKRKNTTGITAEELNYVLEHYSQKNQVDNFDAYFKSKYEKPEIQEKPEVKAEKPKTKKTPEKPKASPKKEKKPEPKKAEKPAPVQEAKETSKMKEEKTEALKAAPKKEHRTFDKPKFEHNQPKKSEKEKPAVKKNEKQKLGTAMMSSSEPSSEKRRTVDTRGSYVNLDKYNERYEQIAPQSSGKNKDNYTKKQKITQKSAQRNRNKFSSKRETETERLRRLELERARKQQLKVLIPDEIVVSELASRLKVTATEVIKKLMGLGVMATINEVVDFDTAALVADELGAKVEKEVIVTIEERLIDDSDDDDNLQERSPVVVVFGEVLHGKNSLVLMIRN